MTETIKNINEKRLLHQDIKERVSDVIDEVRAEVKNNYIETIQSLTKNDIAQVIKNMYSNGVDKNGNIIGKPWSEIAPTNDSYEYTVIVQAAMHLQYPDLNLKVDSRYGDNTKNAVIDFEKKNGLPEDKGRAGPKVLSTIYDLFSGTTPEVVQPTVLNDTTKINFTGLGTYESPDGWKYTGELENGKFHGEGIYTRTDGSIYEGDFIDDKRTGKGKLTQADGSIYEGDWIDDKRTGKGVYINSKGVEINGEWENDLLVKHGTDTFSSGKSLSDLDALTDISKLTAFDINVTKAAFDNIYTGYNTQLTEQADKDALKAVYDTQKLTITDSTSFEAAKTTLENEFNTLKFNKVDAQTEFGELFDQYRKHLVNKNIATEEMTKFSEFFTKQFTSITNQATFNAAKKALKTEFNKLAPNNPQQKYEIYIDKQINNPDKDGYVVIDTLPGNIDLDFLKNKNIKELNIDRNLSDTQADAILQHINPVNLTTLYANTATSIPKELVNLTSLSADNATSIPKELVKLTGLYTKGSKSIPKELVKLSDLDADNATFIPKELVKLERLKTKAKFNPDDFPALTEIRNYKTKQYENNKSKWAAIIAENSN